MMESICDASGLIEDADDLVIHSVRTGDGVDDMLSGGLLDDDGNLDDDVIPLPPLGSGSGHDDGTGVDQVLENLSLVDKNSKEAGGGQQQASASGSGNNSNAEGGSSAAPPKSPGVRAVSGRSVGTTITTTTQTTTTPTAATPVRPVPTAETIGPTPPSRPGRVPRVPRPGPPDRLGPPAPPPRRPPSSPGGW